MLKKLLILAILTVGACGVGAAQQSNPTVPTRTVLGSPTGISWYPQQCDAIDYCAPVNNVAWIVPSSEAAPQLIVSSGHRRAIVQQDFAVGRSEDGQFHVCMRYDPFGNLEVTCLLVPSRMF